MFSIKTKTSEKKTHQILVQPIKRPIALLEVRSDEKPAGEPIQCPLEDASPGLKDRAQEEEPDRLLDVWVVEHGEEHAQPAIEGEWCAKAGHKKVRRGGIGGRRGWSGSAVDRLHDWGGGGWWWW